MRIRSTAALAALALAAAAASAAAQPWTEPDPAAVVGRWRGAVRWQRCAIDGAPRVALEVVRDGSGYRIDLAALADGWGVESLAALGGDELEGNRADLRVTWRAGKPGRASLTVTLGSGCVATAILTRASIGAPPCDELVALAAIADGCDALTPPAVDVGGLVARLRTQRRRGRGDAAACRRAAPPLRAALVTAGCVPDRALAAVGPRIAECDALIATLMRAIRCDKVAVDVKQRLLEQARIVGKSAAVGDPDDRAGLVDSCRATAVELDDLLPRLGC